MKKVTTIATIAVLILAVMFSMLPTSAALAAAHADVTVTVKNRTGGAVTVNLRGEGGNYSFTYSEPGLYEFTVPEGKYDYYATTPCGNQSGQFNLNVNKELFLSCKDGGEILLSRPGPACDNMALWYTVTDGTFTEADWFPIDWGLDPAAVAANAALMGISFTYETRCADGSPTWGWWNLQN
jgi:hypothetical protein